MLQTWDELYNVPMPDLQPETIERLKKVLPEFASPRNPLDMTAITSDTDKVCMDTLTALGNDSKRWTPSF